MRQIARPLSFVVGDWLIAVEVQSVSQIPIPPDIEERQRSAARITSLEKAVLAAKEAVRKQVTAEVQSDFERRLAEVNRVKTRNDRRYQDESEEWEEERRRTRRQIAKLEEELKEVREAAFKSRARMEQ